MPFNTPFMISYGGEVMVLIVLKYLFHTCRCRHGYFHVVNNDYTHWEMYAIGGSADPTINSQGNRFLAPNDRFSKEVRPHLLPFFFFFFCKFLKPISKISLH